jgi:HAD superfamily hydrolase (TIGR01549 family)
VDASVLKKTKVVVLDFDGTVVDTMGGFAEVASRVLNRFFGTPLEEGRRQYLETSGLPFRQQLEILHPGDEMNDAAAQQFEQEKLKGFFLERINQETKEVVSELKKRGYVVVVSSNNYQELVDLFLAREKDCQFDLVLGAKNGFYKGKDHFDFICKHLDILPKEITFVGDSLKDFERAKESRVAFVAKLGTFKREDFERRFGKVVAVESLKGLLGLLR